MRRLSWLLALQADADRDAATRYGVLTSSLARHCARRTMSLVNPQGMIAKVYPDVDPEKDSAQVSSDLATLRAAG